ncbi:hypothetical protein H4Q26_014928, partial [Puccinia striiformis f. sp. tritici PST-130]
MPRTRKRTQSTISSSQPPTQQDADTPQQDADTEEAEDHDKSGEDNIPPTDEEELERAIRNAANGQSAAYQTYGTPELSHKKDKLEPGDEADAIGSQDEFSSDIESVLIPTNDGNDSLDEEDIDGESEEDENDCYTSDSCKETLAK